jgi:hypothetical protein
MAVSVKYQVDAPQKVASRIGWIFHNVVEITITTAPEFLTNAATNRPFH